jgi:hypothetical protein
MQIKIRVSQIINCENCQNIFSLNINKEVSYSQGSSITKEGRWKRYVPVHRFSFGTAQGNGLI